MTSTPTALMRPPEPGSTKLDPRWAGDSDRRSRPERLEPAEASPGTLLTRASVRGGLGSAQAPASLAPLIASASLRRAPSLAAKSRLDRGAVGTAHGPSQPSVGGLRLPSPPDKLSPPCPVLAHLGQPSTALVSRRSGVVCRQIRTRPTTSFGARSRRS
jgi:hypothetical protein